MALVSDVISIRDGRGVTFGETTGTSCMWEASPELDASTSAHVAEHQVTLFMRLYDMTLLFLFLLPPSSSSSSSSLRKIQEDEVWRLFQKHTEIGEPAEKNFEVIAEKAWKLSQSSYSKGKNLVQDWERDKDSQDIDKFWRSKR